MKFQEDLLFTECNVDFYKNETKGRSPGDPPIAYDDLRPCYSLNFFNISPVADEGDLVERYRFFCTGGLRTSISVLEFSKDDYMKSLGRARSLLITPEQLFSAPRPVVREMLSSMARDNAIELDVDDNANFDMLLGGTLQARLKKCEKHVAKLRELGKINTESVFVDLDQSFEKRQRISVGKIMTQISHGVIVSLKLGRCAHWSEVVEMNCVPVHDRDDIWHSPFHHILQDLLQHKPTVVTVPQIVAMSGCGQHLPSIGSFIAYSLSRVVRITTSLSKKMSAPKFLNYDLILIDAEDEDAQRCSAGQASSSSGSSSRESATPFSAKRLRPTLSAVTSILRYADSREDLR